MTATRPLAPRELARQLLAREIAGAVDPATVAAAMQRVCSRVSENLRRSVGDDGHDALVSRAVALAEAEHPALMNIRRVNDKGICLDDVAATVESRGLPVVTEALEAMFASLIEILSSLIGADMVPNIIDHAGPTSSSSARRLTT